MRRKKSIISNVKFIESEIILLRCFSPLLASASKVII